MDRNDYEAPARGDSIEQHGIAPATLETETGVRYDRDRIEEEGGRLQGVRDQFGSLQEQFTELLNVRSVSDLEERVRRNPWGTIAFAAGLGYALERTHLLDGMVGGMLGVAGLRSRDLSRREERLLAWLNDAYALEQAQIPILENHADDAHGQPHVRQKDLEHLEKTRQHAKRVKECIGLLGEKPSKAKDAMGRIGGAMDSLATEPFQDEVVRNFLMDYAAESLEIISYEAIIELAEQTGNKKIARICEEILEDEIEMANWLRNNLPNAVRTTLNEIEVVN